MTSVGPGGWTRNASGGPTTFTQRADGLLVSGNGFTYLSLTGPETRGGVAYTVKDVTYRIVSVSAGGGIDSVTLDGYNGAPTSESFDNTNRTSPGCYTLVATTATRAGRGFQLYLKMLGGPAANVTITNVNVAWDIRTALGALEDVPVEALEPRADGS